MIPPELPSPEDLAEKLEKLDAFPGSVVLIAIEAPPKQNFYRATKAWLSATERKALRTALERARKRRAGVLSKAEENSTNLRN